VSAPHAAHVPAAVAPSAAEYVPLAHRLHTVAPVAGWYDPAAHLSHALAPDPAPYVPAAQSAHTVSPVAPVNFPAAQLSHALAPDPAPYVPAAHSVHTLAADVSGTYTANDPGRHDRHADIPLALEYVPDLQ
jgi:hypothetical protein